jgi:hypothetical protein
LDHSVVEYSKSAMLKGAILVGGLTIRAATGKSPAIGGMIGFSHCVGCVNVNAIVVYPASLYGVYVYHHSGHVSIESCTIDGGDYAIYVSDGGNVMISNTAIYNSSYYSVFADDVSHVYMQENRGNAPIKSNRGSIVQLCGPQPSGNANSLDYQESWAGKVFTDNARVDQGSAGGGTTTPTIETTSYSASTASYKGSGSKYRDDLVQGWYSGIGRIRGCMWFYNAGIRDKLRGKTVLSATLQLAMRSNVGRGVGVTVELSGTSSNSGASSVAVTTNYGVLGTANPGETVTFTLPTAAVTDLVNGTINGLMLYSSDTGAYKEREYSKNYAVFEGSGGNVPVLTVTYQ